jgi:hypothetical protein
MGHQEITLPLDALDKIGDVAQKVVQKKAMAKARAALRIR